MIRFQQTGELKATEQTTRVNNFICDHESPLNRHITPAILLVPSAHVKKERFVIKLKCNLFFSFETGSCYAILAGLELTIWTRLALNSQRSTSHCLLSIKMIIFKFYIVSAIPRFVKHYKSILSYLTFIATTFIVM